jgi:hypothetical protein
MKKMLTIAMFLAAGAAAKDRAQVRWQSSPIPLVWRMADGLSWRRPFYRWNPTSLLEHLFGSLYQTQLNFYTQIKNLPWLDPRDPAYGGGAKVNGTTDDTSAYNSTVTAACALVSSGYGGAIILVPPGTSAMGGTGSTLNAVTLNCSGGTGGIAFVGVGGGNQYSSHFIINPANSNNPSGNMFQATMTSAGQPLYISGISVDMTNNVNAVGINLSAVESSRIEDFEVIGGAYNVKCAGCGSFTIQYGWFYSAATDGIYVLPEPQGSGCGGSGCGGSELYINDNHFDYAYVPAAIEEANIHIHKTNATDYGGVYINRNLADNAAQILICPTCSNQITSGTCSGTTAVLTINGTWPGLVSGDIIDVGQNILPTNYYASLATVSAVSSSSKTISYPVASCGGAWTSGGNIYARGIKYSVMLDAGSSSSSGTACGTGITGGNCAPFFTFINPGNTFDESMGPAVYCLNGSSIWMEGSWLYSQGWPAITLDGCVNIWTRNNTTIAVTLGNPTGYIFNIIDNANQLRFFNDSLLDTAGYWFNLSSVSPSPGTTADLQIVGMHNQVPSAAIPISSAQASAFASALGNDITYSPFSSPSMFGTYAGSGAGAGGAVGFYDLASGDYMYVRGIAGGTCGGGLDFINGAFTHTTMRICNNGHQLPGGGSLGPTPTLTGCGTSPTMGGTDTTGYVITGSSGTFTTCTITFANAYTDIRYSEAHLPGGTLVPYTISNTAMVLTIATNSSAVYYLVLGQ